MPIRPENRDRYPADWKAIRQRILARAGHRCEFPGCGVFHRSIGYWRLRHRNRNILATSEGYTRRASAARAAERLAAALRFVQVAEVRT